MFLLVLAQGAHDTVIFKSYVLQRCFNGSFSTGIGTETINQLNFMTLAP